MTDDSKQQAGSSPLASGIGAPEFVPSSQMQFVRNNNTGNAASYVPGADRGFPATLGIDASPFVPSANGEATVGKIGRINASAAEFVPSSVGSSRSPGMSTAAPAFVPRGSLPVPQGGWAGREGQRAETRLSDSESGLGYLEGVEPGVIESRVPNAQLLPGSATLGGQPRPGGGNVGGPYLGPFPARGGRGGRLSPQQPQQQQASPPLHMPGALKSGRFLPGRAVDGGGRGRGRGRAPFQPGSGAGFQQGFPQSGDALGRVHVNAVATADQLIPQLQTQSYLTLAQMPSEIQVESGIPEMVQQFHSLYPLEDLHSAEDRPSIALGVQSVVLKGISIRDNQAYALRKISRRQVHPSPELAAFANEAVEAWSGLQLHPHLAVPRQAFVSMEVGGQLSLFIAHEYFPGAFTLDAAHQQPQVTANGLVQVSTVAESTLWSYLMQFAAALRAVHSLGMACRAALHISKVLLTAASRIRIGSLGVTEILAGKASRQNDVAALQREDLQSLGHLLLQLACCAPQHVSLEQCAAQCSPELTHIVASLLGHHEPITSWHQLTTALGEHAFAELDARHIYSDAVTAQLAQEMENGRLLRLLAKLSMVTERADMDTHWAETGDRYLLKLFRDFVFHQCTEEGAPILEWGHVVECLNKLDAGVPEKIVLLSRDEASMLVVSYADVKRCIEATFGDLRKVAAPRPLTQPDRP